MQSSNVILLSVVVGVLVVNRVLDRVAPVIAALFAKWHAR